MVIGCASLESTTMATKPGWEVETPGLFRLDELAKSTGANCSTAQLIWLRVRIEDNSGPQGTEGLRPHQTLKSCGQFRPVPGDVQCKFLAGGPDDVHLCTSRSVARHAWPALLIGRIL